MATVNESFEINETGFSSAKPNQESARPPLYQDVPSSSKAKGDIHEVTTNSFSDGFRAEKKPVTLTWENICVNVPQKRSIFGKPTPQKAILKNVSGYAEPGSILAILGGSGEGKSTFLNTLTSRNLNGLKVTGKVLANGVEIGHSISKISAYVQQDDLFMGELTVKEHLTFTARLRMDPSCSETERSERVQVVLRQMGLAKCEHTFIGTPGVIKGISGGEMKRLNVASELLTNPSLLFLDEPTTGLDSYLAKVIVKCLQTVARQGCTVICTIHQPNSGIFNMLDRLLLVSMGQTVYHGDRESALNFFEMAGHPCPTNFNPADFYVKKISMVPGQEEVARKSITKMISTYETSDYARGVKKVISGAEDHSGSNYVKHAMKDGSYYSVGFFDQLHACFVRAIKTHYRNPIQTKVFALQSVFLALLIGLIYLRTPFGSVVDSTQVIGMISGQIFLIVCTTFVATLSVLNTFPLEIPVFQREHFNGMYSTLVFFMSKTLAEIPNHILTPLLFSTVSYFLLGLYPDATHFMIFFALMALMINTCVSYGYMISTVSSNMAVALASGPAALGVLMIFSGFFEFGSRAPAYLAWIRHISWFYYMNELLNINTWQDMEYLSIDGCNIDVGNSTVVPEACVTDGESLLAFFRYNADDYGFDVGMMICLFAGYRLIALLLLYFRVRPSRR